MGMGMPHADVLDTLAPHVLFGPTPKEAEGAANVPEVSENEPVPSEADNTASLQELEQALRGLRLS